MSCWQDLAVLQDKLRISTKKLEEYETLFKCQEETTQKLVLEYQARLEEGEERLRRQQEDKDIQMKGIISRLGPLPGGVGPQKIKRREDHVPGGRTVEHRAGVSVNQPRPAPRGSGYL